MADAEPLRPKQKSFVQTGALFRKKAPPRTSGDAATLGIVKKKKKKRKKKTPPDISSQRSPELVTYHMKGEDFTVFDYYRPVKAIGKGAYATVIEAVDMRTGVKVAIKKNKNVFNDLKDSKRMLREMKLLMVFQQDDVIKLLDVIPPDDVNTFTALFLVMPRMETTLEDLIMSDKNITDKHVCFFVYQMFRGLKYIHSANIVHRDIKPANILINGRNCKIKITDFGLSRGVADSMTGQMTEYVATRWYRPPEVIFGAGQKYDEKIDIWATVCIFGELITRKVPLLPGKDHMNQLVVIFETLGKPEDLSWVNDKTVRDYVRDLKLNPSAETLDVKLQGCDSELAIDLIKKCLALNPVERLSACEVLEHEYLSSLHNESMEISAEPMTSVLTKEEEISTQTEFGLRHVMYESLTAYHAKVKLRKQQSLKKKKPRKKKNRLFKPTKLRGVQENKNVKPSTKLILGGLMEEENSNGMKMPRLDAKGNAMLMNLLDVVE